MKICPNCKAPLEEDAVFCGECGQRVSEAAAGEAEKTLRDLSGMSPEESRKNICPKCGAEMPANKSFCADCGTPIQGGISHEGVLAQAGQPLTMPQSSKEVKELNPATVQKIALAGAVMTFVSVFLPLCRLMGLEVFLLDAKAQGKIIALVVVALGGISYQALKKQEYAVVAATGQTILWPLVAGYIYYSIKKSSLSAFERAIAGNMISVDIGGYCLILGSLFLVMSGLLLDGTPLDADALVKKWKEYIVKPIQVSNFAFPSFGWIIGIPVVVWFILEII